VNYHKNFIIEGLRRFPEELPKMMPEYSSVEEAIKALEAHPGEWVVDGELLGPDDPRNPIKEEAGKRGTDAL
jgi:hypothetical protein